MNKKTKKADKIQKVLVNGKQITDISDFQKALLNQNNDQQITFIVNKETK